MNGKNTTRRKALQSIGAVGIGVSIGIVGEAAATKGFQVAKSNYLSEDESQVLRMEPVGYSDTIDNNREAAGTVQVYYSKYVNGQWEHDWAFTGEAQSWPDDGYGISEAIHGHSYKIKETDGTLLVNASSDIGAHPSEENDSLVPEWTVPLLSAAIGTILAPIGWFTAGSQAFREKFGPDDGYNLGGGTFKYTNTSPVVPWKKCGHYARFLYRADSLNSSLTVKLKYVDEMTPVLTTWDKLEMDVTVKEPGPGCGPGIGPCTEGSDEFGGRLKDPVEMSDDERETLGIRKVDETSVRSMDDDGMIRTSTGEVPEFIAKNPPLAVTDVRRGKEYEER